MDVTAAHIVDWVLERRYELVLPVWGVLLGIYFLLRRFSPPRGKHFFAGIIALGATPPVTTVLMWPGARWPTYTDTFFERAYHRGRIPTLEGGFSTLLYHPGYITCGLLAFYSLLVAASGGKLVFSKLWAYAALAVLFALEEFVFFNVSIDS